MSDSAAAIEYAERQSEGALDDLFELLAQPSISATDEGIEPCLDLAERLCAEYGFDESERIDGGGQPALLARAEADADDAPEILIYGHYDVQPADPDEWTTPPFEPTIREGPDGRKRIYARGAGDNKGQWFAHLAAVRALRETTGLPVSVSLLLEGEEESGSPTLPGVVESVADRVDPELAYIADGPIDATGRPHVLMGARGILYVQVDAQGPDRDLHSGNYGGPAPNPAWALIELFDSMKDDEGRVTIEGFYDDVRPITDADRAVLEDIPFDADRFREEIGAPGLADGPGDEPVENLLYYPTLNVAGLTGGYGGEGMKTIVPSTATAKVDMRLVADQDPDHVYERFREHVESHAPDDVTIEVSRLGSMDPQRTPLDHPIREPIVDAVAAAWDGEPILKPSLGGSLPTYVFADALDVPCVTVPYANSDENNHSPDENLALWCFESGVRTTIELLGRIDGEE